LSQFLGKKNVVLFFYPRDEGPVCIKEAEHSEITEAFKENNAEVIGIRALPITIISRQDCVSFAKTCAVVGGKHSGKTAIIEHLSAELKCRGSRAGAIKEIVRIPTLDKPATETDRYWIAGTEIIVAVPRDETVVFIQKRLNAKEILP
jgi:hypothetical protein